MTTFVSNLKLSGIDTLGLYCRISTGGIMEGEYDCSKSPWKGYVQWIDSGKVFYRQFRQGCELPISSIPKSALINYCIDNKDSIVSAFMFDIDEFRIDEKGDTLKLFWFSSHPTQYILYCELGKDKIGKRFSDDDISSEKNKFKLDNICSKLNLWRIAVENQIKELK